MRVIAESLRTPADIWVIDGQRSSGVRPSQGALPSVACLVSVRESFRG